MRGLGGGINLDLKQLSYMHIACMHSETPSTTIWIRGIYSNIKQTKEETINCIVFDSQL